MFDHGSNVPMLVKKPQPPPTKPQQPTKPQPTKPQQPRRNQPRRNPDRGVKIQVKPPNQGGYTDRKIASAKAKKAVAEELLLLGPVEMPEKDKAPDAMGRALHWPEDLVLQPATPGDNMCYLPALRFATGLSKPIAPSLVKLLQNMDAPQINKVC